MFDPGIHKRLNFRCSVFSLETERLNSLRIPGLIPKEEKWEECNLIE